VSKKITVLVIESGAPWPPYLKQLAWPENI